MPQANKAAKFPYQFRVEESDESADILLYGYIGENYWYDSDESSDVENTDIEFVTELSRLEKKYKRINVRINSGGGSMYHGNAMVNAILNSSSEIHTYNDGMVASMAFTVFMAAPNRHWGLASLSMDHQASSGAYGNKKDFQNAIEMLEAFEQTTIEVLMKSLDMSEETVRETFMLDDDKYINRKEAKKLGLITVDDSFKSKEDTKQFLKMKPNQVLNFYKNKTDKGQIEKTVSSMVKSEISNIKKSKQMLELITSMVTSLNLKLGITIEVADNSTEEDALNAIVEAVEQMTPIADQITNALADAENSAKEEAEATAKETEEAAATEGGEGDAATEGGEAAAENKAPTNELDVMKLLLSMKSQLGDLANVNKDLATKNAALSTMIGDQITKDSEMSSGGTAGTGRSYIEQTKAELVEGEAEGESTYK